MYMVQRKIPSPAPQRRNYMRRTLGNLRRTIPSPAPQGMCVAPSQCATQIRHVRRTKARCDTHCPYHPGWAGKGNVRRTLPKVRHTLLICVAHWQGVTHIGDVRRTLCYVRRTLLIICVAPFAMCDADVWFFFFVFFSFFCWFVYILLKSDDSKLNKHSY